MTVRSASVSLLLFCLASVSLAFHVVVPLSASVGHQQAHKYVRYHHNNPMLLSALFQSSGDSSESELKNEIQDLPFAESPFIPEPVTPTGGSNAMGTSVLLGLYVLFVIADSIFHFTPEENYGTAIGNFVKGLTGN